MESSLPASKTEHQLGSNFVLEPWKMPENFEFALRREVMRLSFHYLSNNLLRVKERELERERDEKGKKILIPKLMY